MYINASSNNAYGVQSIYRTHFLITNPFRRNYTVVNFVKKKLRNSFSAIHDTSLNSMNTESHSGVVKTFVPGINDGWLTISSCI